MRDHKRQNQEEEKLEPGVCVLRTVFLTTGSRCRLSTDENNWLTSFKIQCYISTQALALVIELSLNENREKP